MTTKTRKAKRLRADAVGRVEAIHKNWIEIDLSQAFREFWEFYGKRSGRTLIQEATYQLEENALSLMDGMDGSDVAASFNLSKEYAKWKKVR